MLGVIVSCFSNNGVDEALFDRYHGKTILEHTTFNALKAEYIQKVIVLAPVSARSKIAGQGIFQPGLKTSLEALRRNAIIHYADITDDGVKAIYHAALKHSLDKMIVIDALKPLIQPWLINDMAKLLHKTNNVVMNMHDEGFKMYGCTFSHIASAQLYAEKRDDLLAYLKEDDEFSKDLLLNNEGSDSHIIESNCSLVYKRGQEIIFDYLLSEMNKGAEINDLIEDIHAKQEEDQKQR